MRIEQCAAGHLEVRVLGEIAGDHLIGRHDDGGVVGRDGFEDLVGGRHDEVAAEDDVGAADTDAHGLDVFRALGKLQVAGDRATLLGEAGHVDCAEAFAFDVGGLAEDSGDGDDAGAADAGDEHGVGSSDRWLFRAQAGW